MAPRKVSYARRQYYRILQCMCPTGLLSLFDKSGCYKKKRSNEMMNESLCSKACIISYIQCSATEAKSFNNFGCTSSNMRIHDVMFAHVVISVGTIFTSSEEHFLSMGEILVSRISAQRQNNDLKEQLNCR